MSRVSESIGERGNLRSTPMPQLLLDLYRARFEGRLIVSRDRTEKRVEFQKGAPIACESNAKSESLGAQLIEARLISPSDHNRMQDYVRNQQCQEGAALLALGLLDPKGLFTALKHHLRKQLEDCFSWPDGDYQIEAGVETAEGLAAFRINPHALVQHGLAAHWSTERMLERLSPRIDQYPGPAAGFEACVRAMESGPEVERLLAQIDGRHTLGQALASVVNSPIALAAMWVLDAGGLLDHGQAALDDAETTIDGLHPELEIEVAFTDAAPDAAAAPSPAASKAGGQNGPASDRGDELCEEIARLHAALPDFTYYEMLGLEPNASPVEIKKAYFKLAKTFHPDAVARMGLGDIDTQAQEVFSRIAEAFDVLSSASKRSEYDSSLAGDSPDIDVDRLAQAEALYLKGEVLLNMGNFKGALEFLGPAAALWPEESDYQSACGWALYKKSPPEPEKAREHLAKALTLAPDSSVNHFRMGTILRSLGELQTGAEHLARAKMLEK